jgi:hypothetical protein
MEAWAKARRISAVVASGLYCCPACKRGRLRSHRSYKSYKSYKSYEKERSALKPAHFACAGAMPSRVTRNGSGVMG